MEEELLLVDRESGAPRSVASQLLRLARQRGETEDASDRVGGSLGPELQEQQVETDTPPEEDLARLGADLEEWRSNARSAAAESGALILASGTTPLPVRPQTFADERFARITQQFGLTATEQLSCGFHVHVAVDSDDEAVGALDRIRCWLPVLLALSANSPFWRGADSGYHSFRSQVMARWPTNGPTEVFGSAHAYTEHLRRLTDTGVPLDDGMAYFDARPSRTYPTLEVRVCDVCLEPQDAVVIAALVRGLVDTGAQQWAGGEESSTVSVALLRLAMWQAGRRGVGAELLDPQTHRPRPARAVVEALAEHVGAALEATGDTCRVEAGIDRIFTTGTGSVRQRAVLAEERRLDRAVVRLAEAT